MNGPLAFANVFRSLTRFRARTVLGALGIVVSVIATVFVLSMSAAVRSSFDRFVGRMYPADVVTVNAGARSFMGGGSGGQNMRVRDIEAVVGSVPGIVAWDAGSLAGGRDVRSANATDRYPIMGSSAQAPLVRRRTVMVGEHFDQADVDSRARVALIGTTVLRTLFGEAPAVGETIFIDNMPFTVKGVLTPQGVNPHGADQDNVIVVPYTVVMESLLKVDYVMQAAYQVADPAQIDEVASRIAEVMRQQHEIVDGRADDFAVVLPGQIRQMVAQTFATIGLFAALICGAAFLISALVVLAVMNVSVRQRTPELGLRRAVGAHEGDVRNQILWEALVIAGVGSVLGAILAVVALSATAPVFADKFGITGGGVTASAIGIGVAAALATGLIGAVLPARRAARLNPVEALRH